MRSALSAAALALVAAGSAEAGLEICNNTDVLQSIAIGYTGETDWTSEGWWNIEAGDCVELVPGNLTKRYYYYYAESETDTFRGQSYTFCTETEEFTIVGDTDCEDRGYETSDFREVDTGETATSFTLTLVDTSAPSPGGATGSKGPGGGEIQSVSVVPDAPRIEAEESDLHSGGSPGEHGKPFQVDALFQGCEIERGATYCGFHADGVKLVAFYRGPTSNDMIHALEVMPLNTPVRLSGDEVERRGREAAVVLRDVRRTPGSDNFADLRKRLQGDWVNAGDDRSEITIRGSEIYVRFNGDFRAARFLSLADRCDGLRGAGPVLLQSGESDARPKCYRVARADDKSLDLEPVPGGAQIRFRRQ